MPLTREGRRDLTAETAAGRVHRAVMGRPVNSGAVGRDPEDPEATAAGRNAARASGAGRKDRAGVILIVGNRVNGAKRRRRCRRSMWRSRPTKRAWNRLRARFA